MALTSSQSLCYMRPLGAGMWDDSEHGGGIGDIGLDGLSGVAAVVVVVALVIGLGTYTFLSYTDRIHNDYTYRRSVQGTVTDCKVLSSEAMGLALRPWKGERILAYAQSQSGALYVTCRNDPRCTKLAVGDVVELLCKQDFNLGRTDSVLCQLGPGSEIAWNLP